MIHKLIAIIAISTLTACVGNLPIHFNSTGNQVGENISNESNFESVPITLMGHMNAIRIKHSDLSSDYEFNVGSAVGVPTSPHDINEPRMTWSGELTIYRELVNNFKSVEVFKKDDIKFELFYDMGWRWQIDHVSIPGAEWDLLSNSDKPIHVTLSGRVKNQRFYESNIKIGGGYAHGEAYIDGVVGHNGAYGIFNNDGFEHGTKLWGGFCAGGGCSHE